MRLATSLVALFLAAVGSNAAITVLHDTGWEDSPASPAWALGNVPGQNGWLNFNSPTGHTVVGNGTAEAVIGVQTVTRPHGTQLHRFTGNTRTDGVFDRVAWPNIMATYNSRPAGQNIIKGSIDVFVPGTQTYDRSLYGIVAYHGSIPNVVTASSLMVWGVLIEPDDRSVNTWVDGNIPTFLPDAFALDTWFNVTVTANYDSGQVSVDFNGVTLPDLTITNANILSSGLSAIGLFVENAATPPTTRSIFTDNFRLTAEDSAEPRPTLTIDHDAIGKWHLSWSATFSNWVLESTQNIAPPVWTNAGAIPNISAGAVSVDLPEAHLRNFYRLRKP